MKLYSIIRVELDKHELLRQPGALARQPRAFGGEPQRITGKLRAAREAAMLIDVPRRALAEVGANDAVALVIDDLVLFEERDRRPNDLGDLFLGFHEHAPAIDADFRVLRLTVEHLEAGVHYAIEMQAHTGDPESDAPVRMIISGRIAALEPRKGETAERYRARVEPLIQHRVVFQMAQASFESFVARARDALARSLPDAHVSLSPPVVAATAPDRGDPNPMLGVLGLAMLCGSSPSGGGSLLS